MEKAAYLGCGMGAVSEFIVNHLVFDRVAVLLDKNGSLKSDVLAILLFCNGLRDSNTNNDL